jgi:hypothetical protein
MINHAEFEIVNKAKEAFLQGELTDGELIQIANKVESDGAKKTRRPSVYAC